VTLKSGLGVVQENVNSRKSKPGGGKIAKTEITYICDTPTIHINVKKTAVYTQVNGKCHM